MAKERVVQLYLKELETISIDWLSSNIELPELLFHYTSAELCFLIIQTPTISEGGPRLWASCALGMNDATEVRYGIDLVREVASEIVPQDELERSFAQHWKNGDYARLSFLEQTCVACFCDRPDLLSQWRAYGKSGTGYCLGFRRDILSEAGSKVGFKLVPIIYRREEQIQKVRMLFDKASAILQRDRPEERQLWRAAIEVAVNLSLAFKHESFSEEREWRLISPNPRCLNFRAGRWGVIPYAEIPLPKNALAEIWQGPTLDYDLTRRTLEMYLVRTYGVNDAVQSVVQVRRSEIPLRKI